MWDYLKYVEIFQNNFIFFSFKKSALIFSRSLLWTKDKLFEVVYHDSHILYCNQVELNLGVLKCLHIWVIPMVLKKVLHWYVLQLYCHVIDVCTCAYIVCCFCMLWYLLACMLCHVIMKTRAIIKSLYKQITVKHLVMLYCP